MLAAALSAVCRHLVADRRWPRRPLRWLVHTIRNSRAQAWAEPLHDGVGSRAHLSPAAAALRRHCCMLSATLCCPKLLSTSRGPAAVLAPCASTCCCGDRSQRPCPLLTAYTRRPVRPARATRGALATTRGVKALQAMEAAMSASCKPSAAPRRLGGGLTGRGGEVSGVVLRLDGRSRAPGHDLNAVMWPTTALSATSTGRNISNTIGCQRAMPQGSAT